MSDFLWLTSMSAVLAWPLYIVAGVLVAAAAWHQRDEAVAARRVPLTIFAGMLVAPVVLPAWAALTEGLEAEPGSSTWASWALVLLALAVLAAEGWGLWRAREAWPAALACAGAAALMTVTGCAVGSMAIANAWP
jgi:hypothetical protein